MNLMQDCQNGKLTVIAMHKFVQEMALDLGLSLEGSLLRICAGALVNRTQVYERKKQLEEALTDIELASPGRPACLPASDAKGLDAHGGVLREQVLLFRLDHPGAPVS